MAIEIVHMQTDKRFRLYEQAFGGFEPREGFYREARALFGVRVGIAVPLLAKGFAQIVQEGDKEHFERSVAHYREKYSIAMTKQV